MRPILLLIGLCAAFAGPALADDLVYFGSRTNTGSPLPLAKTIFAARFDPNSGRLTPIGPVAEIMLPTWLAPHPTLPVLYSVSEVGNDGTVEASLVSLAVDTATGRLTKLNTVGAGGGGATHISVDAPSNTLFVANYGTGQVSWLPMLADGRLGMPIAVQANYGKGPNERQDGPHPHGVQVDPSHRFVLSSDMGADRTFVYRFDAATRQLNRLPQAAATAPGAGPRHMAFHPNGRFLFMLTQLSAELISYRWDAGQGRLSHVQALPTDPVTTGEKRGAHIETSHDGRFVYVSNRGVDTLGVFAVDARTGVMRETQRIASGGRSPSSFSFDPSGRWLLVANNDSNAVAVFAVDPASGLLSPTRESLSMPNPSNVTFFPAGR